MAHGPKPKPIGELFWSKVDVGWTDDCWGWTASIKNNGYGQFGSGKSRGLSTLAHRAAYQIVKGDPGDLVIDHLCNNKRCVNPQHLDAVTQETNVHRACDSGLVAPKIRCPQGHEYTEENTITERSPRRHGQATVRRCRKCRRSTGKIRGPYGKSA